MPAIKRSSRSGRRGTYEQGPVPLSLLSGRNTTSVHTPGDKPSGPEAVVVVIDRSDTGYGQLMSPAGQQECRRPHRRGVFAPHCDCSLGERSSNTRIVTYHLDALTTLHQSSGVPTSGLVERTATGQPR